MTYQQQLKHPLWQRKKTIILQRDEFTCQKCSDKETELQVHHLNYRKGRFAWEYDDRELQTLCAECHFKETLMQIFDRHQLSHLISKIGFSFKNCKGEDNKLEAIIDIIYWLSTLPHVEVEEYALAAEIKAQKSFTQTPPINGKEVHRFG
jgi:5-methylcytosine-specific restriction endonuclease McrA